MAYTTVTYYADLRDQTYNTPTTLTFSTRDEAVGWAADHDTVFTIVSVTEQGVGTISPPYTTPQSYVDADTVTFPGNVVVGGELTVGGGTVGGGFQPWQFYVEDDAYGAVGDNSTNDRVAIQAAIDAAVTYATTVDPELPGSGNYYAEVIFAPKTYYVGSGAVPTRQGTNVQGQPYAIRAYVMLPHVETTGRKLVLVLRGTEAGDPMAHWLSTTPQRAGTVIRTDVTGLGLATVNTISMAPALVGGPVYGGSNQWSNLLIKVDGITAMAPVNPGIIAWDFVKCANMACGTFSAMAEASVAGTPSLTAAITNDLGIGLRTPQQLNNDNNHVVSFHSEGFYTGVSVGDHFSALRLAVVYSRWAMFITGPGTFAHGLTVLNFSIEAGDDGIVVANTGGFVIPIFVGAIHMETMTGQIVDDPGNRLYGEIHWASISSTVPPINGAGSVRIINDRVPHGSITGTVSGIALPAVPASTTPLTNPYWRDAAVTVTGGTVTQIAVDGQNKGITSGTVIVPTGKSVTVTYSVAPTWTWTLL